MNIFILNKNTNFAAGLHWQTVSNSGVGLKRETTRLGKKLRYDLVALHGKSLFQAGFANSTDGYKEDLFSAAAAVDNSIVSRYKETDFLCATKLPDGRYLYVVKIEGAILPDGDLIAAEDEVHKKILTDIAVSRNWSRVIAPSSWKIEGSEEIDFIDLVSDSAGNFLHAKETAKLKLISLNWLASLKRSFWRVVGILFVISACLGYFYWKNSELEKDVALLAEEQAALAAVEPLRPWRQKAVAISAVEACIEKFDSNQVLHPSHWKMESAVCNVQDGVFIIKWLKGENGWISHLIELVPDAIISADLSTATLSARFSLPGRDNEELVREDERTFTLLKAAQEYGLTFNVSRPTDQNSSASNLQEIARKNWKEFSWNIKDTRISPIDVTKILDGPGFSISSMTAKFREGNLMWDMEGIQYVATQL